LSVDRAVLTGFIVDGGSEAPFSKLSPSTGQGGGGGGEELYLLEVVVEQVKE
jgi:hypothetical protein